MITFLFNLTSVNIEWTRQVFENIAPNARLNPAIKSHARAVQTINEDEIYIISCEKKIFVYFVLYGNAAMLLRPLSNPRNMTLKYVNMHPIMIRLFKCGLDILIYLKWIQFTLVLTFPKKIYIRTVVFCLPLIPISDIKAKKNRSQNYAHDCETGQNCIYGEIHLTVLDNAYCSIFWRRTSDLFNINTRTMGLRNLIFILNFNKCQTNPFQWLSRLKHELVFNRIEFADFHFFIRLKLLQQDVGASLIIIESNRTLSKCRWIQLPTSLTNFLSINIP